MTSSKLQDVIRYGVAVRCRLLLGAGSSSPDLGVAPETLCPTWSVVYEFLRVVTHRAVLAEHGIRRIYGNDAGLHRFPGLEGVDPRA